MEAREPRTLIEAIRYFADPDVALKTMVELRWPGGVHCPTCGRTDVRFIATRRMWECKEKHPRKQFSAKVGTIMEDSPLGLDKWFTAIWLLANCKNGISSYEVARDLGITQKSAWHMMHRIRLALQLGSFDKFSGIAEADEAFVGGRAKNMHAKKRKKIIEEQGGLREDKTAVVGILERNFGDEPSRVRGLVVKDNTSKVLQAVVRETVEPGSILSTDSWHGYRGLQGEYKHYPVDHSKGEYVKGFAHVNGVENFWSLLKRSIKGTYVSVEHFHLQRYVDEQVFRFNQRKGTDQTRFRGAAGGIVGKRLTYKELIGHGEATAV
jgi:transposase-like protein